MPKPTIGRTVLCHLGNAHPVQRSEPYPATITRVNGDGTVDLHVLGDHQLQRERTQTNVVLPSVRPGEADGQGQRWWWPEIKDERAETPVPETVTETGVDGEPVAVGATTGGDEDGA